MIKYSLRCAKSHEFEGWFKDSDTYERQEKRGLLECPACGTAKVERALMAPNLPTKGNARKPRRAPPAQPPAVAAPEGSPQAAAMAPDMPPEMRKVLLELRNQVEKNCDYVGDKFAEEARKIHYGETDKRGIYGETSDAEASALAEEGIEFGRLPWVNKGN